MKRLDDIFGKGLVKNLRARLYTQVIVIISLDVRLQANAHYTQVGWQILEQLIEDTKR